MRISFLAFTVVALVASSMTAASAFNYATIGARSASSAVVADDLAYLAIDEVDSTYGCFVDILASGKIDLNFNADCAGQTGTGINAGSIYYFHDVLKVTNKGRATLTNLWFNATGSDWTIQTATSSGSMVTGGSYSNAATATSLAVGSSIYLGFKIDADGDTTTQSPLASSLTIAARSTN